jgi:ribosome modulation factor
MITLENEALERALADEYKPLPGTVQMQRRFGLTAFKRGWNAGIRGEPLTCNPYPDRRTERGNVTFSRAYRRRWLCGWRAALIFLYDKDRMQAIEYRQSGEPYGPMAC